jgi:hypothetical protein
MESRTDLDRGEVALVNREEDKQSAAEKRPKPRPPSAGRPGTQADGVRGLE